MVTIARGKLIGAVQDVRRQALRRLDNKTAIVPLDTLTALERAADRFCQAMIAQALSEQPSPTDEAA